MVTGHTLGRTIRNGQYAAASDIDLWIVDLCLDNLEAELEHVNLDNRSRLSARKKLSLK